MKREFIYENFLLQSTLAEELYHGYAENLPAIDFHSHLNPEDISANRKFANIAEAWVLHDPYKHRAMRISGVNEAGITGQSGDEDKFFNWARTVPKTVGNPLYSWSALELYRVFGIDTLLNERSAEGIWRQCNKQLQGDGYGALDILKKFRAEAVCTSDDLLDALNFHEEVNREGRLKMLPSLRGDSMLGFGSPPFNDWFNRMQARSGLTIKHLDEYKAVIVSELDRFSRAGCRLADHSLDAGFRFDLPSEDRASEIFARWQEDRVAGEREATLLRSHLHFFLAQQYAMRGWILQLHIGAQRFTSSRLRHLSGAAGGYAAIGKTFDIGNLCLFFDELEKSGHFPEFILYNLNPSDNETFATLTGSFIKDGVSSMIQFGPAWWYNDQYDGIKKQLTALANCGLLTQFIGMTTDSRSVFSFSRHEYFRRILCNELAAWVKQGIVPDDMELLSEVVLNVSYYNCKRKIFNG